MKKRLTLARALMHDPAVLLMDEATNGLDPSATEELLDFIRDRVTASARAVLWATHRLEEVLTLCDRVIVLIAGRIRFHGAITEFTDWCTAQARTQIEVECSQAQRGPVEAFVRSVGATIGPAGTRTRITLATGGSSDLLSSVLRGLLDRGANVRRVEPQKISLSETFDHLAQQTAGAFDDRAAEGHA
jgi:ABC-type multidrug transport system ATPase subunit